MDSDSEPSGPQPLVSLATRVLVSVLVALFVFLAISLAWYSIDILLVAFAGVLFAIFLRTLAGWLARIVPLSSSWSLVIVIVMLATVTALALWFVLPNIAAEIRKLQQQLPQAVADLRTSLEQSRIGSALINQIPSSKDLQGRLNEVFGYISQVSSITLGVAVNLVIFFFVGLYLAFSPSPYKNGLLALFPPRHQKSAEHVLSQLATILKRWLFGRLISMTIIGILTAVGLWSLGIPLAVTLALLAALLTFIPNIGPVLSVIPAALLGLAQGLFQAAAVVGLYAVIQFVESYLVTPLIQRQAVYLPPALIIIAQVIMGLLVGALGLILATPLTAASVTLIKIVYVEKLLQKGGTGDREG